MRPYGDFPRHIGFWRRAAAYGIDAVIVTAIWFAALELVVIGRRAIGATEDYDGEGTAFTIVFVALPLFWFVYQWVCNTLGMSWGKRALQLDVVRVTEFRFLPSVVRPGIGRGLLRTLGQALGAMAFGLGFFWVLWDKGGRTWADVMAGTRVIGGRRIPQPGDNLRFKYKTWSFGRSAWVLAGAGALLALVLVLTEGASYKVLAVPAVIAYWAFLMLMARVGNYVELRPAEVRFQSLQGRWGVKYADVDNATVTMDGKIELKFRRMNWLGRPKDETTKFEIESDEAFVKELVARVEAAQSRPLLVVH